MRVRVGEGRSLGFGKMGRLIALLWLALVGWIGVLSVAGERWDGKIVMPTEEGVKEPEQEGERWAVVVAGSAGYGNYRHQVG
jgi:hypothetical protein